ncbi:hypothetical protein SEA_TROOPER_93 [Mycobacterium phage Trooper]|nr:hypothetical protein SEA_TROOPER_93 [Mycobacterium phage Trooper]
MMDAQEIAIELRTVAELHKNQGNVAYAKALLNESSACFHGFTNVEESARILGKAEEAL